ncbi:hypothetical protein M419DRAFT_7185 [Trichoderma reesei RUT C-30]|uniref:Uncharacterized protein n=1 Tax=Hypocrea jecorina (strain ATCC 56765 / BCRC 32924 / NRRL 11460 / Rut C-30) TaxID=1344414 RepID=A0A024SCZ6_HYPJR|nr:hypothetical protein M419DRAFT_7185 [Trichoderma reesei RUT C-30]
MARAQKVSELSSAVDSIPFANHPQPLNTFDTSQQRVDCIPFSLLTPSLITLLLQSTIDVASMGINICAMYE